MAILCSTVLSPETGSGAGSYTDSSIAGVANRVYQVTGASCCSQPVGFAHVQVPAGKSALVANQFEAPSSALNGLFNPMPDGTYLPNLTQVSYYNPNNSWTTYTWTDSGGTRAWSTGASTNYLWPGQGVLVNNPGATSATVTFAGLVRVGGGPSPIAGGVPLAAGYQVLVSPIVPQPGGLSTVLGYSASQDDLVQIWNQATGQYDTYTYTPSGWSPSEPVLAAGESFFIDPAASQTWNRVWLPYCDSLW